MQLSLEVKTHKIILKYKPERTNNFALCTTAQFQQIQKQVDHYEKTNEDLLSSVDGKIEFPISSYQGYELLDLNAQIMISKQRKEVLQHCVPVDSDTTFRTQFYNIDVKDVKSREIIQGHDQKVDDDDCQCRSCITSKVRGYRGMIVFCEDCGCFSPWTLSPIGDVVKKDGEDWQPTESCTICLYCN